MVAIANNLKLKPVKVIAAFSKNNFRIFSALGAKNSEKNLKALCSRLQW